MHPIAGVTRSPVSWSCRALGALAVACLVLGAGAARAGQLDAYVSIGEGPQGETTSRDAVFAFTTAPTVGYTTCQLDGAAEVRCGSPASYGGLGLGAHRFLVRAYSSRGGLQGSDARSWTVVEGQAPPPPPPTTPPPTPTPTPTTPSPPPVLRAMLVAPPTAPPGGLVLVDASGSTGPIGSFAFDLDGNGSYETKCGSAGKASAVYPGAGAYAVGVQVTAGDGTKSTAKTTVAVAGAAAPPPKGGAKLPSAVTVVGGCSPTDLIAATIKLYLCPTTVTVGVAEAVFPADAPAGACFKRTAVGSKTVFVAPHSPVQVDGVVLEPQAAGGHVEIDATQERLKVAGGGATRIVLRLKPPTGIGGTVGSVDWNVASPSTVADLEVKGILASHPFLGLPVAKAISKLGLTAAREATLPISVALPVPVSDLHGAVVLRTSNTDGLVLQAFEIALAGDIGIFPATGKIGYANQGGSHVWSGTLQFFLAPPLPAVQGKLSIRDAYFEEASVALDWGPPGYGPVGCCLFLQQLSGTITIPEIAGSATFTGGPSAGKFAIASGTATAYVNFDWFLIAGKGSISVLGVPLGAEAAWALDTNGIWFKGGVDKSFLGVLSLVASVKGGIEWNGSWALGGNGKVCAKLPGVGNLCAGGIAGIGDEGVAGCLLIDYIAGGVYVQWDGDWGFFKNCWWSLVESRVTTADGSARVLDSSATPLEVRIPSGLSRVLFEVRSAGLAPHGVLRGPGNRTISFPTATGTFTDGRTWSAIPVDQQHTTFVTVLRPPGGTWTLEPAPGSPPIASVGFARPLPSRIVTGTLNRRGDSWALQYRLRLVRGQTVTLVERGEGIEHGLGRVAKLAGELRFTPAESPVRTRQIDAVVTSAGLPIRTETVARFRVPPLRPLPAPRLTVRREGGSIVARWLPVQGAARYRASVLRQDGTRRSLTLPGSRPLRLTASLLQRLGATVAVRAQTPAGRLGKTARVVVAAPPPATLGPVPARAAVARAGFTARCAARADGACTIVVRLGKRVVAAAARPLRYGAVGVVRARPVAGALPLLRRPGTLQIEVSAPGERVRSFRVRLR